MVSDDGNVRKLRREDSRLGGCDCLRWPTAAGGDAGKPGISRGSRPRGAAPSGRPRERTRELVFSERCRGKAGIRSVGMTVCASKPVPITVIFTEPSFSGSITAPKMMFASEAAALEITSAAVVDLRQGQVFAAGDVEQDAARTIDRNIE